MTHLHGAIFAPGSAIRIPRMCDSRSMPVPATARQWLIVLRRSGKQSGGEQAKQGQRTDSEVALIPIGSAT